MSDIELCWLSASEALRRFRDRELSPLELLDAVIARAEQTEARVNALCFRYFDEARALARSAEQAWMDGSARPLEGLPLAAKDEAAIAGKLTTNGSLLLRDYVPDYSEISVRRLQNAGAVIHARTTTPEFSCAFVTWSKLWGVTRNPWNPDITPGGSSGGAGAALAAGSAVLASGTDIAGSIRMPAAMCGVVGYKPPYGRVPQSAPWNLDSYCHDGPLARTVADCALMQNVIAGPHASDHASLAPRLIIPPEFENIRGWRIGRVQPPFMEVDADVQRNTERALELFRAAGAKIVDVDLNWDRRLCERTALIHLSAIMGAILRRDYGGAEQRAELTSYMCEFFDSTPAINAEHLLAELEYSQRMQQGLGAAFARCDLIVLPTVATTRVAADFDSSRDEVRINGRRVSGFLGWTLTWPFNTLSRCPVLALPSGLADNGVPTGIQLVGRPYDELAVFQGGAAYEAALGGPFIREGNRPGI